MRSQNDTPTPKTPTTLTEAIIILTQYQNNLLSLQDIWKPNEQIVIHPVTKDDLSFTYGQLRTCIQNYIEMLESLQRMLASEKITPEEHNKLMELGMLQNIPEIKDYPQTQSNSCKP